MIVMAVVNLALLTLSEKHVLPLAWSWLVIFGTAGTILLAIAFTGPSRSGTARATPVGPSGP